MEGENDHLLIDIIQQYPLLYDKSHNDYKNNNKKENAWQAIASTLDSTGIVKFFSALAL